MRKEKVSRQGQRVREEVEQTVEKSLKARGVEDVPEVVLLEPARSAEAKQLRSEGALVLRKDAAMPPSKAKAATEQEKQRRKNAEKKAQAIAQLLHCIRHSLL